MLFWATSFWVGFLSSNEQLHWYWYSKWCEATKKSNLKPVGVPFHQEVGGTRKDVEKNENDTHKSLQETVIGGLRAPKEAGHKDFSASEENESEIWIKGDSCCEVTK